MTLGRTAMLWLAANMVVTTLLTGTLFVPGIENLTGLDAVDFPHPVLSVLPLDTFIEAPAAVWA